MLSLLMRLAPFADVYIARIACSDSDLMAGKGSVSQKRLADVSVTCVSRITWTLC